MSKIAQMVLERVWYDRGFPVDPVRIAAQLGIKVLEAKMPNIIYGALIKKTGKDPLIIISEFDSKPRQRFSCAYELGRYIKEGNEEYDYIDLRSDKLDAFAKEFAVNLLMPKREFKKLLKNKIPTALIAHHFGVSDDALRLRLK
jgi:Zn-dependent peptidase ImmA (M78 family)